MEARSTETGQDIVSADELDEIVGTPVQSVADKVRPVLDPIDLLWIAHTPLIMLATSAADGTCDVSPKGDPPGFVKVLDEHTLAVPERPGNRRVDGFRNVLSNPHAGLIFLIPGREDTLRVNGRARLVRDAPYFDDMIVKGNRPIMALELAVEEVFYHCAKAFLRSAAWKPESWDVEGIPSRARISKALERPEDSLELLEAHYGPRYAQNLY